MGKFLKKNLEGSTLVGKEVEPTRLSLLVSPKPRVGPAVTMNGAIQAHSRRFASQFIILLCDRHISKEVL